MDEDILRLSICEGRVVSPWSVGNTSINDRNIVHSLSVEVIHKVAQVSESTLINLEVPVVEHVVNVRPLNIQRNSIVFIPCNHILQISGIFVAPSALVPS